MRIRSRMVVCIAVLGAASTAARAQTLRDRGYTPVEHMAGDTDRMERSLRYSEPGLGEQGGQNTNVFRRAGVPNKLYYISQGITAEYDVSQYTWLRITK